MSVFFQRTHLLLTVSALAMGLAQTALAAGPAVKVSLHSTLQAVGADGRNISITAPWVPPVQSAQGFLYGLAATVWSTPLRNPYGFMGYAVSPVLGSVFKDFTFGETMLSVQPAEDDNAIWYSLAGNMTDFGSPLVKNHRNEFLFSVYTAPDDTGAVPSSVNYGAIPKTSYAGPYKSPEYGALFKLVPQDDGTLRRQVIRSSLGTLLHPGALAIGSDDAIYGIQNAAPYTEFSYTQPASIFKFDAQGNYLGTIREFARDHAFQPINLVYWKDEAIGSEWLYGLGSHGGTTDAGERAHGTVFRLRVDGTGFEILHRFGSELDGMLNASDDAYMGTSSATMVAFQGIPKPWDAELPSYFQMILSSTMLVGQDGYLYINFGRATSANSSVFRIRMDGSEPVFMRASTSPASLYDRKPYGPMVLVDGYLYGTLIDVADNPVSDTGVASKRQIGELYRIDTRRLSETPAQYYESLFVFEKADMGIQPSGLMRAADGKLYGSLMSGPGGGAAGALFVVDVEADRPSASLTMSISQQAIELGDSVILHWTSEGAANCVASGDWAGPRAPSAQETIKPVLNGTFNYTLTCDDTLRGAGATVARAAGLMVAAPDKLVLPETDVHEGGGSWPWGPAALLGLWLWRRRAQAVATRAVRI